LLGQQLVKSTRGPGGGYSLRLNADDISLADIALAVDDALHQDDHWISRSMQSEIWAEFNNQVLKQLRAISLGQLVRAQSMQMNAEMQAQEIGAFQS
jgi:Rrf2 family iron-sulfur cluster assembly transcriptional regulator